MKSGSLRLARLADERQAARDREDAERNAETVEWIRKTLWGGALNAPGTLVETYLRSRGITCQPPATLGFLEAYGKERLPAMIAAFGLPTEPDPGELRIRPDDISGAHLTFLRPDGSGKAADAEGRSKIIIGRGHTMPIVLAPPNDVLGLVVAEGIEDALSWHMATGLGAWAAGTANRLPGVAEHVPDWIDSVTIIEDLDPAGRLFSRRLADALVGRDIEVFVRRGAGEVDHAAA